MIVGPDISEIQKGDRMSRNGDDLIGAAAGIGCAALIFQLLPILIALLAVSLFLSFISSIYGLMLLIALWASLVGLPMILGGVDSLKKISRRPLYKRVLVFTVISSIAAPFGWNGNLYNKVNHVNAKTGVSYPPKKQIVSSDPAAPAGQVAKVKDANTPKNSSDKSSSQNAAAKIAPSAPISTTSAVSTKVTAKNSADTKKSGDSNVIKPAYDLDVSQTSAPGDFATVTTKKDEPQ